MKSMKWTVVSLICLLAAFAAVSGTALALTPSTGDKVLDARLDAINDYAANDREAFVAGVCKTYNMDQTKVEGMLDQGMTPADVYMALRIAVVTGQSPEAVEKAYLSNPGKGWGVIAKSLGIKPGSKEFKSLKDGTESITGKEKNAAEGKTSGKQSGKNKDKGSDNSGGSDHGGGSSSGHGGGGGKGK